MRRHDKIATCLRQEQNKVVEKPHNTFQDIPGLINPTLAQSHPETIAWVPTHASYAAQVVERLNAEILDCAVHLSSQILALHREQDSVAHSASTSSTSGHTSDPNSNMAPYSGPKRKLVVGIDVGTTFSGVSYCILDPGVVPVVQGVHRYPAQSRVGGDAKIPSIIYYDASGSVQAVGAEAKLESNIERAADQHWVKVEWFKLHLRTSLGPEPIPPIPQNKTIVEVFGDFLRYLYQCTRAYIEDAHADGTKLWKSVEGHGEFVLTHPNGWREPQIAKMRAAAIYAGLVPDNPEGHAQIRFVTEGEASLHYCARSNYASDMIKSGEGVLIVDAGGGTVDLSAYRMTETQNCFEEIARGSCHFQGSMFVSHRARTFLKGKLSSSRYDTPEDIQHISDCFDKSTKLSFKDPTVPSFIKFGTPKEMDSSVDVKFGQLKLAGPDMVTFFEPSIITIQDAIKHQTDTASARITAVLLVGGFAASYWLFSKLQTHLQEQGIRLARPDGHLGKAVADGAVLSVVDQSVSVRTSANAGHYDRIKPWVGDAITSLLEDVRDAKDPSVVVRAAVETCLINSSRHLIHGTIKNEGVRQTLLALGSRTATEPVNADDSVDGFIVDKLSTILLLAGYSNRNSQAITDALSSDVKSITKSILELRGTIASMLQDDLKFRYHHILQLQSQIVAKDQEIAEIKERLDSVTTASMEFSNKCMEQAHELDSIRQRYDDVVFLNERMAQYTGALDAYKAHVAERNAENDSFRKRRRQRKAKVDSSDKRKSRASGWEPPNPQLEEEDECVEAARQARNEANSAILRQIRADVEALQAQTMYAWVGDV